MEFSFFESVFVIFTLLLTYIVHPKLRVAVLTLAGILYCLKFNVVAPITIVITVVITYIWGLLLDLLNEKARALRVLLFGFFIILCIASLAVFKLFEDVIQQGSIQWLKVTLEWLFMSTGFSYYIFQAVSYMTDIYKGKIKAERSFFRLALYLSFFPKISSGPIERFEGFSLQLESLKTMKIWDPGRYSRAASFVLYGFFMKILLADRIGPVVKLVFESPGEYNSLALITTSFLYTLQIYLDFAGYSCVAIGVAQLFGIKLSQNFLSPYFSSGFVEFWRRWHITLGSWLRDYVYIPLGGNKKGKIRQYINIMIVFVLCGLWHDGRMSFVVWGVFHALFSVLDRILSERDFYKNIPAVLKRIITFLLVSFAWIFFGAGNMDIACSYITGALTNGNTGYSLALIMEKCQTGAWDMGIFLTGLIVVIYADIRAYKANRPVPEMIEEISLGRRLVLFYLMTIILLVFGAYGPGYDPSDYIYTRF